MNEFVLYALCLYCFLGSVCVRTNKSVCFVNFHVCMCICMCTCSSMWTFKSADACMYDTHIHVYIHTHTLMRKFSTHSSLPVITYMRIHTYIHTYIHTHTYIYRSLSVGGKRYSVSSVCVCVYVSGELCVSWVPISHIWETILDSLWCTQLNGTYVCLECVRLEVPATWVSIRRNWKAIECQLGATGKEILHAFWWIQFNGW